MTYVHWSLNIIWNVATVASIITIASIAADRYLMVAFPFKHHSLMSGKKIIMWITFTWILCSSSSLNIFQDPRSKVLFIHSINLYIGIIIIFGAGVLYILTFLSLRKQARNLIALHNTAAASNANSSQRVRQLRDKRFLNTIVVVACMEVIGIAPSLILYKLLVTKGIFFSAITRNRYTLALRLHILLYACYKINPLHIRFPNYCNTLFALYWKRESHQ